MAVECDDLATAVWVYDIDRYRMRWANAAALEMWGSDSLEELCSRDFKSGTSDAVQESLRAYQELFTQGQSVSMFWRFSPKGINKEAFCRMSGYILEDGRLALLIEATPSQLLNEDFNLRAIVTLSTYHADGRFISGNPPFIEEIGADIQRLDDIVLDPQTLQNIYQCLAQEQRFAGDVLIKTHSGDTWYHLIAINSHQESGDPTLLVQQYNIHERKTSEISLTEEALTDPLTGLLNRRGLSRELENLVSGGHEFILFYIDLDGFKMINDSFGHAMGDQILQSLAERLCEPAFAKSVVSRFGGDEFIVVVNKNDLLLPVEEIASKLVRKITETYHDDQGSPLVVSASIGIAQYPDHGQDVSQLIVRADAAMYFAKRQGKRRWVTYMVGMEQNLRRYSLLAQRLYLAEQNNELSLNYQPIFDVKKNHIIMFEALLRWKNREMGQVTADETIRVAEETGIIGDIENWVIRRALADLIVLRKFVAPQATMAINVSGIHFSDPKLPEFLLTVLDELKLKPDDLTVELTESSLLSDISKQDNPARRITEAGIQISIDDFGTGYSSLAYLHEIPASIVKVDKSFAQRVADSSKTVEYIHGLIQALGMKSLIEGVETERQQKLFAGLGIQLQQGFGLGYPRPLAYYIGTNSTIQVQE